MAFDDIARKKIGEFGGIYAGIYPSGISDTFVVACESGVLCCSPGNSIRWSHGYLGLVTSVDIASNVVCINRGEPTEARLSLDDGSEL